MSFDDYRPIPIFSQNRGMTLFPAQQEAINRMWYDPHYAPQQAAPAQQQQNSGGGGFNFDFNSLFNPGGGAASAVGGGGMSRGQQREQYKDTPRPAQPIPRFRNRTGLAPAGYQPGGGQWNQGAAAPPPATTNPQVPIGGGGGGGQTVSGGITSGQLSNDSIQASLQSLLKGGLKPLAVPSNMSMGPGGSVSGGLFGDLMRESTLRSSNEFSRAASQQQADMQHAFEVARANGDLQQMQLLADTNRENVTNQVTQRNTILDLLGQLLRGFGGV